MNKTELRVRWEERVSTADKGVLDKLWQDLTEQYSDYIDDALRDPRLIADLVDVAEDRIEYWRLGSQRGKPPGRAARTIVEVDLDDYEKECAQTASLYLAKKAASLPEVRRFRQERLGGKLVTTEEAEEFLREELKGDVPDDRPLSDLDDLWIASVSVMGLEQLLDFVVPIGWSAVGLSQRLLFPYEGSSGRMWSRKKIAENYRDLCLYLAGILPWHLYDAARFLLTGEYPEVVLLELSYQRPCGFFTLNFAPWISEKTFRKAYRKCQKVVQGA